jgi:hypothetical protein
MGLVNGTVLLKNPRLPELGGVEIEALDDSGAVHLCMFEGDGQEARDGNENARHAFDTLLETRRRATARWRRYS